MTHTIEQDIDKAFFKFLCLKDKHLQLDILCESMTERDNVLGDILEALEANDNYLIGKIVTEAIKDYAHDCSTGHTL